MSVATYTVSGSTSCTRACMREAVVASQYGELVKGIAYNMVRRMPPSVDVEDLIQAGMIGLIEAHRRYSGGTGASFETYAASRIRGAMIDELRRLDWMPRQLRRRLRDRSQASRQLAMESHRQPREAEIAERMGITLDECHQIRAHAGRGQLASIEDHCDGLGSGDDPAGIDGEYRAVTRDAFIVAFAAAVEALPEREKLVLSLYFEQGLNLRQIGDVLGVTESRVCQMRAKAVTRLRGQLSEWLDEQEACI